MSGKACLVVALIFVSAYTATGAPAVGGGGGANIGSLVQNVVDSKVNLVRAKAALGAGIVRPIIDLKAGIIRPIIDIKKSIARPIIGLKRDLINVKKNVLTSLLRPLFGLKATKLGLVRDVLDKKINFLRGF